MKTLSNIDTLYLQVHQSFHYRYSVSLFLYYCWVLILISVLRKMLVNCFLYFQKLTWISKFVQNFMAKLIINQYMYITWCKDLAYLPWENWDKKYTFLIILRKKCGRTVINNNCRFRAVIPVLCNSSANQKSYILLVLFWFHLCSPGLGNWTEWRDRNCGLMGGINSISDAIGHGKIFY